MMQDSIPTLPTGTCIFSGVATQMPLKINVRELEEHRQPKSQTCKLSVMVPEKPRSIYETALEIVFRSPSLISR